MMEPRDPLHYFMRDLGGLLRELAIDAKLDCDAATGSDDGDLKLGRRMAFYEVLSLIEEQAMAFGLDDAAIGLQGFSADRDLL